MIPQDYEWVERLIREAIAHERARLSAILTAVTPSMQYDYRDGTSSLDIEDTLGRVAVALEAASHDHLGEDETKFSTWQAWFRSKRMR